VFHERSGLLTARRRVRALALALAVPWLLVAAAGAAWAGGPRSAPPTLESLLADFREVPGVSARFREERRIALLRKPLVSSGRVYFAPPDRLARHVEEPRRSTALIEGGALRFGADGTSRSLDLETNPAVRGFVDGFRLLLAGDLEGLRRLYDVRLAPPAEAREAWAIVLRPSDAPLRAAIESIELRGRALTLLELSVRETNGDETRMEFSEVRSDRRFTDAELAELFRLPGS